MGKSGPKNNDDNNGLAVPLAGLDPSTKLPRSLRVENLSGVPLERIKDLSPEIQSEILSSYAHVLNSIAGRNKEQVFAEKRQKDLFQRCLNRVIAAQKKPDESQTSENQTSSPFAARDSNSAVDNQTTTKPLSLSDFTNATIKLPLSHLKLEGEAAKIFHSLPWEQQQSAIAYCDDAALKMVKQGTTVIQSESFFSKTLQCFIETQTPQKVTVTNKEPAAPRQDLSPSPSAPTQNQKQHQPQTQQSAKSKSKQTEPETANSSSSQPENGKKKKNSKKNSNQIQILKKNIDKDVPAKVSSSSSSADTGAVEKLRRELQETKDTLESKTRQLRDQTENNKALKKMWEQEQHIAKKSKERIRMLEDTVQQLRQQLADKDVYVDEQLKDAREIQNKHQEEHLNYREMVSTFSRMSKELCDMQQEKRELEKAVQTHKNISSAKNSEILKLRTSLKMLRPTTENVNDHSRKLARLRRELKDTQDKLQKEQRTTKSNGGGGNNSTKRTASKDGSREKPSLADFVLGKAPDNAHTHHDNVQILRRSASEDSTGANLPPNVQVLQRTSSADSNPFADHPAFNVNNTTVNTGLEVEMPSSGTRTACQEQQPEPEGEGISFHGVDKRYDSDDEEDEGERIKTELDFLLASFGDDEILVESDPDRITRILQLDCDRNHEVVEVHLILTIHEGYPNVPLEVEASLSPEKNPSIEGRKVAMDSLPGLVDMCRWEANGSAGHEALFAVLQTADQWVQNEWHGIQAKRLPADLSGKPCLPSGEMELCRMLVSSHHIVDSEKISFIKNKASSYDLGGYVKIGYPGYVLIEGLQDNCNFFVETIVAQRLKLRNSRTSKKVDSATFSVEGKVTIKVEELDAARTLPKKLIEIEHSKEGMLIFGQECKRIELDQYLEPA